jgi:putative SOS response-associated peptidase YedK
MCGRYRNLQSWSELHAALDQFIDTPKQAAVNLEPREQVRPTQNAPIVTLNDDGSPEVWNARWWLIPWFHKGTVKEWKATTFNARAETVATSRAYRDAFAKRRCLVVADGWYEWMGPRDDGSEKKQPWLFTEQDAQPLMFAGIWDSCETSDEGRVPSFTIVTQPAGAPLNGYHDRAPVTLFGADWKRWLDPAADIADLLGPESRERFTVAKAEI